MQNLFQDCKFGTRMLVKNPMFTFIAMLSLGLGIAANTTIFSVVNALLFRPAPVEAPDGLWQVWRQNLKGKSAFESFHGLSYPGYRYFRTNTQMFSALAAFDPETPFVTWNRDGVGQLLQCQFVSGDFFQVCGVKPVLGRVFSSEEDRQPGADPVAVISYTLWKNEFGQDPGVIGRTFALSGVTLTIIGVAPPKFTGVMVGLAPDLWAPFMMAPVVTHDSDWHIRTGAFSLFGLGRLKAGVSPRQAEAELTGFTRRMEEVDPQNHRHYVAAVFPTTMLPMPFRGNVTAFAGVFMAAVFMVLMIACANAANLMLARVVSRRRELAVRSSLGASRSRLIRQMLTESVMLAFAGGGIGVVLTYLFLPILLRLAPPNLPIRPDVTLDNRVLLFTAFVSLLTGIIFGLAPAWQGTRVDQATALKDETSTVSARRSRFTSVLIAGQLAICIVLLIAGGLCLRSLLNARNVQLGFQLNDRISAEVSQNHLGYSADQFARFNAAFLERVSALPSVRSASVADHLPLDTRRLGIGFEIEGHEPPPGEREFSMQTFDVGPGYFATMGTSLLRGREFLATDREGAPHVVIVNQAMADRFWPNGDAVGQRLSNGRGEKRIDYQIVGVVETGKYRSLSETARPIVFRCFLQEGRPRSTFVVHTRGDLPASLAAIRQVARELDPQVSLSRLGSLENHLAFALFPARATGLLFSVFGGVALLLAVSGLFGVIAYSVSQRTREIGIRLALGACRRDVLLMVVRQGMKLAAIGMGIGLVAAILATGALRSLLFGVSTMDPITFICVPLVLAATALLACWLPARRAAKVDPMVALRYE